MPENRELAIDWPDVVNEDGTPMRWFGAWLVGDEGAEGAWFHSGRVDCAHRPAGRDGDARAPLAQ